MNKITKERLKEIVEGIDLTDSLKFDMSNELREAIDDEDGFFRFLRG